MTYTTEDCEMLDAELRAKRPSMHEQRAKHFKQLANHYRAAAEQWQDSFNQLAGPAMNRATEALEQEVDSLTQKLEQAQQRVAELKREHQAHLKRIGDAYSKLMFRIPADRDDSEFLNLKGWLEAEPKHALESVFNDIRACKHWHDHWKQRAEKAEREIEAKSKSHAELLQSLMDAKHWWKVVETERDQLKAALAERGREIAVSQAACAMKDEALRFYTDIKNFGITVWENETKDGKCWSEPAEENGLTEGRGNYFADFGMKASEALATQPADALRAERLKVIQPWRDLAENTAQTMEVLGYTNNAEGIRRIIRELEGTSNE